MLEQSNEDDNISGEDDLDPRIEIELEKMNEASLEINAKEKELDEARAIFHKLLTETAQQLKQLYKSNATYTTQARPYFEALHLSKKAKIDCQSAASKYEKAYQILNMARCIMDMAEDKIIANPTIFDTAWQEMMNNANFRIRDAEKERLKTAAIHRQAILTHKKCARNLGDLYKKLTKAVEKSRPYFEQRARSLEYLELQKQRVQDLDSQHRAAKKQYSESLHNLEIINQEIHKKRSKSFKEEPLQTSPALDINSNTITGPDLIQSSEPILSCHCHNGKIMSEEETREALKRRQKLTQKTSLDRYRDSLLSELNVDFDLLDIKYLEISKHSNRKQMVSVRKNDSCERFNAVPVLEQILPTRIFCCI